MNTEKMHIEPNTVQETLVIPLWGRKYCSEIYPEIYNDPMAAQIMEKLDYDFSALEAKKQNVGFRFGYLEAAARYTDLGELKSGQCCIKCCICNLRKRTSCLRRGKLRLRSGLHCGK